MNIKGDLVPLIHPHWKKFPMPPQFLNVALGTLYLVVAIVGLVGNSTVVITFLKCSSLRINPSNLLVVNLAMADFLLMVKTPFFCFNSFMQFPIFGRVGCEIYGCLSLMSGLSAIWFLAGISFDRYRVVHHSMNVHKRITWKQTSYVVLLIWTASALCSVLPFLGWSRYIPEGYLAGCTIDYLSKTIPERLYVLFLLVVAWLLPMIAICFAYSYIGIQIYSVKKEMNVLLPCTAIAPPYAEREMRVLRTILFLVFMWTISWTPYAIVALLGNFCGSDSTLLTPLFATLAGLFAKTSACINPYIYGVFLPSFRKEIAQSLMKNLNSPFEMRSYLAPADPASKINLNKRDQKTMKIITTPMTDRKVEEDDQDINQDERTNNLKADFDLDIIDDSQKEESPPTYDLKHSGPSISETDALLKGNLQRFLLPGGQIVLASSYSVAKKMACSRTFIDKCL